MSYKTLDKAAVEIMALQLMVQSGATTNLDVKESLRKDGYFAVQNQVSNFMRELADDHNWVVQNNGTYNTYSSTPYHSGGANSSASSNTSGSRPVVNSNLDSIYNPEDIELYLNLSAQPYVPLQAFQIMYGDTKAEAETYDVVDAQPFVDRLEIRTGQGRNINLYYDRRFKRYLRVIK